MQIEIWSDIVCPWCYIGKRRFETALAQFAHHDQVEIQWRSFELDPHAPPRITGNLTEMLSQKYGISPAQAAAMNQQVTELAANEGLEYRLETSQPGNSFDAHRLIHFAAAHGHQAEAKERLLRAYFIEGQPIGDRDILVAIGVELGFDGDAIRAMLESDAYAANVRADQRRAAGFGIRGVPFFVFDERYGVSGAQTPEILLSAIEQAWADPHR